ncbi:MAG: amidase family protein [Actinomycetota bacterium]|nr:amidase family protein [Actinomycetota bacterium]
MSSLADDTRWLDATAQADLVRTGQVSPSELLEAAIERIERTDPALNAVIIRWFDHARDVAAGPLPDGPFRGVPTLLKDLWAHYAGQTLSNGCQALKDLAALSPTDTTLVSRMRGAGFVVAGRTNSPEFGSLATTEPEAWGATRNPWNTEHSPGGSSGGSAAAVAAGMVPIAHASDGGGSIRIPASACGLVGLKPSQGRITLGPYRDESNLGVELCVSRSLRDTAAFLDAVRGPGIGDTVIAPAPARPYLQELGADPGRLRIGLLDHHPYGLPLHDECATAARHAATLLESLGHSVEPGFPAALANPEFGRRFVALWSTNMGTAFTRVAEQIGRDLVPGDVELVNWAQAEFARGVNGVDYALALAANVEFRRAVQQWWHDGFDLLLTPTLGEPPAAIGTFANDPTNPMAPMVRALTYVPFTPAFNASGQPAISLPLHWTPEGLPIGVQLVAAYGREDVLLRVAAQLEAAQPWADRHPTI